MTATVALPPRYAGGTVEPMSVPVALAGLRDEIAGRGGVAFFISVGSDGRPHTVQQAVRWADPDRLVVHPGHGTVANAAARPLVTLLWPPTEAGGYSLIVDAKVVEVGGSGGGDNLVAVQPTKAVLHRPARSDDPDVVAHGSDCVGVFTAGS
jgi:hypothetical protein